MVNRGFDSLLQVVLDSIVDGCLSPANAPKAQKNHHNREKG
jgi:hypothetical protein